MRHPGCCVFVFYKKKINNGICEALMETLSRNCLGFYDWGVLDLG